MRARAAKLSELIHTASEQFVCTLRHAATELGNDRLDTDDLTDLLKAAFSEHYRVQAALTGAIGALGAVAEKAPDGELTMGLTCATWLSHNLHISSSAAYAQVRLARQLPSLPSTAAAFDRGELSPQHAGVVART